MEEPVTPQENCCHTDNKKKCCWCSPQMIFNYVAGALILALLAIVIFNPFKPADEKKERSVVTSTGAPMVAYVETDSIISQYQLVKDGDKKIKNFSDSLEKDMTSRAQNFQNKANAYQVNLQNGKITTQQQADQQRQALEAEQQKLMEIQQSYRAKVSKMQDDLSKRFLDSISSVVKNNPDKFPFDYVLSKTTGSSVLYVDKKFDITNAVIKLLNEQYNKK